MKKKNGMTMVEIMISVALISIVMIFVFNILVDLRQEETLNSYKNADQINRSVITKTIQKDFLDRGVKDIKKASSCSSLICLDIYYKDGNVGHINVAKQSFSYGLGSDIETWKLQTSSYSDNFAYCYYEKGDNYYFQLLFPVDLTASILNSKMIFDIELLFMGKIKSDVMVPTDGYSLGAKRSCDSLT